MDDLNALQSSSSHTQVDHDGKNDPTQSSVCLKKARYHWQIKNKRPKTSPESSHKLKKMCLADDEDSDSSSSFSTLNCEDVVNKNDSNSASVGHWSQSTSKCGTVENSSLRDGQIADNIFQQQYIWAENRGSSVGILLKSMDEVVDLAHRQANELTNIHPQQLKHIMKGITDNSINKILEATGAAPGKKRRNTSFNFNCENLEDEAVSEVIRQQGIQSASCSKSSSSSSSMLPSTSASKTSFADPTSFNTGNLNAIKDEDVIDAAVFSAISNKGLGVFPT